MIVLAESQYSVIVRQHHNEKRIMIRVIIFDFDGVIIDSLPVRELGFKKILEGYEKEEVDQLIEYHRANGGLSRFVKIRYFFEEILGQTVDGKTIDEYADAFSKIMRKELVDQEYLIRDTVEFIECYSDNIDMHIVSGSEENELRYLCEKLGIEQLFKSIQGSPTTKTEIITGLMKTFGYGKSEVILIGDSINDYHAAEAHGIAFYGYNNLVLKEVVSNYLEEFGQFPITEFAI